MFYGGTKLSGVNKCYFEHCNQGVLAVGAGINIIDNNFLDNIEAVISYDNIYNSSINLNTITSTKALSNIDRLYGALPIQSAKNFGIFAYGGSNSVFEISRNKINNIDNPIILDNVEAKLKCNNLQNNMLALYVGQNSKINMNEVLGGGFNNASNCEQFAEFNEAYSFEANYGSNAFNISDSSPCYLVPESRDGFTIIPAHYVCPTITSGSLIDLTQNNDPSSPYYQYYETAAENNFWANGNIEEDYNKIYKLDAGGVPLKSRMVTGTTLASPAFATCPGGVGCTGPGCRTNINIHPLDDNSNSSYIHTPSFVNERLQKAVKYSLNKLDKMQNALLVNEAANLFTEILKENYMMPVKNKDDKYLLDLAYQKLFSSIAQLTEWERDNNANTAPLPTALQNRFNDLHTINTLRVNRKDVTEPDSKEINDLVYLDKAMVYRLAENRTSAIHELNTILANQPKAEHRPLYEYLLCIWSTEDDALKNTISVDEAISRINECNNRYSPTKKAIGIVSQRTIKLSPNNKTVYANNYAIDVYPNPTFGNLSITYSLQEFSKISFDLFDVHGKKMYSSVLNPEEHNLNIDNLNLENGVYFYSITGDSKNLMTKKLVVVK